LKGKLKLPSNFTQCKSHFNAKMNFLKLPKPNLSEFPHDHPIKQRVVRVDLKPAQNQRVMASLRPKQRTFKCNLANDQGWIPRIRNVWVVASWDTSSTNVPQLGLSKRPSCMRRRKGSESTAHLAAQEQQEEDSKPRAKAKAARRKVVIAVVESHQAHNTRIARIAAVQPSVSGKKIVMYENIIIDSSATDNITGDLNNLYRPYNSFIDIIIPDGSSCQVPKQAS
jgi:hypothetical protein